MTRTIDVARDFDPHPIGRYRRQGRASGEAFRDDLLWPALEKDGNVIVILDGTAALSTGFLDEAFAGLVREGRVTEVEFWKRIGIVSEKDPYILDEIRTFVSRAARMRK